MCKGSVGLYARKRMNSKIPEKIRLAASLYCNPGRIYSITVVANFKREYFLKRRLAMEAIECLKLEREKWGCKVFVYCLMPDHLHFLTSPLTSKNSIIDLVNRFKGKSTTISWKYGIKGSLWQRRWYDHILRKDEDIQKIGGYILANPMRRGLVQDYHVYPYCGHLDGFDIQLRP